MPGQRREVALTTEQERALIALRDHAPKPYLRERAAAILKVAEGIAAAVVARERLLRVREPDTIYDWLDRFAERGIDGLKILPGRGRKPAFSPSAPRCRGRPAGHPARRAP